jgi:hypothetical protein
MTDDSFVDLSLKSHVLPIRDWHDINITENKENPYPLIINHGVLENPPFRSMIFALKNINICMVDLRSLCSIEYPPFIVGVLSCKPPICIYNIYIYSENSSARFDCQRVNTSKSLWLSHYHPYRFPLNPIRSWFVDGETSISQPWQ